MGRLPDFIIIGAMRSGTSSLHRYLGAHPEVFVPEEKELHFFDRSFERGTGWYQQWFAPASDGQIAGETTPNYLHDPEALRRIQRTVPGVKLVVSLRNPIDRAYSHYWHNVATGKEPLSFEDALAAEEERVSASDTDRAFFSYRSRGFYARQLRLVDELVPDSPLHILVFEDLTGRPREVFVELCRFLGVGDSEYRPPNLGAAVNRYTEFRSVRIRRLSRGLPAPLRRVVGRLNTRRDATYPPMDEATRAGLADGYAEDVAELSARTGRDLSSVWSIG